MSIDIGNINSMLMDVLRELGNIGSGNAATALASMINKKVDMKVPQVKIIDIKEITEILGGAENPIVGIYFEMSGDIEGNIMLVFNIESAKNLVNLLYMREKDDDKLDEMDISALAEVGNILSASYVNSLSKLTNLNLSISIPSVNIDMAGAILSTPAIQFSQLGDSMLFIETEFLEDNKLVSGDFFLLPEIESFEVILKSLGVY